MAYEREVPFASDPTLYGVEQEVRAQRAGGKAPYG
jgi:hypothetical protein